MSSPTPIPRRAWAVTAVTSTTVVLTILDSGFVSLAFPDIVVEFLESSPATLSWVSAGFFVALASLMLLAGRLADRFGAKRIFLSGLAIYCGGAVLTAAAPSAEVLILARLLQGAGAAALAPVSLAMALPEFPPDRRSTAIGAWAMVGSLAAIAAPLIGGVVIDRFGWRAPFLLLAVLLVVAAVFGQRTLPDSAIGKDAPLDLVSVPLMLVAVGGLALGLSQGRLWGWSSPGTLGSLAAAAIALPILIRRSAGSDAGLLDVELFGHRPYLVGSAASVLTQLGFFSFFFPVALFFVTQWDYSVLAAGLAIGLQQGVSAVAGVPVGRWADRVGPGRIVTLGGGIAAVGLLYFALMVDEVEPNFVAAVLPAFVVSGLGMMMNGSISTSAALGGVPDEALARATSGFYLTRRLASGLGVVAAATILGDTVDRLAFDRYRWVWAFSAACYALSALVTWLFYEPRETRTGS